MGPRTEANRSGWDSPVDQGTALRRALAAIIDAGIFDNLRLHGNTKWMPTQLVGLAVLWAWSDQATLTAAFVEAARWAIALCGGLAVHSYQGLTSALVTWTGQ
jgi:hypothetical protein